LRVKTRVEASNSNPSKRYKPREVNDIGRFHKTFRIIQAKFKTPDSRPCSSGNSSGLPNASL
jgi:hypothetical protein